MTFWQTPTGLELHVPHSRGAAVAVVLGAMFVSVTVGLAIWNLLQPRWASCTSLLASCAWLALVSVLLAGFTYGQSGPQRACVFLLGHFSMRQFVSIERAAPRAGTLSYGYHLRGRRFEYLRVDLDGIRALSWSAGQASDRSGRDRDDWSVAIWCDSGAVHTPRSPWDRSDREHVEIIGLTGPRDAADRLGKSLVELLSGAGVVLRPDAEGRRYQRAG